MKRRGSYTPSAPGEKRAPRDTNISQLKGASEDPCSGLFTPFFPIKMQTLGETTHTSGLGTEYVYWSPQAASSPQQQDSPCSLSWPGLPRHREMPVILPGFNLSWQLTTTQPLLSPSQWDGGGAGWESGEKGKTPWVKS